MRNTYQLTRPRRWALAASVSAAMTVATALILVPSGGAAPAGPSGEAGILVICTAPAWAEGTTYALGAQVTYNGRLYQALVAHTAYVGAGWNPAATPSLWKDLGACTGTPPSSPPPPPSSPPPTTRPP